MYKLWGLLKKDGKIIRQAVSSREDGPDAFDEALQEICAQFDIEKPVLLNKHERELQKFSRTVFRRDDFLDSIPFDTFEVENITKKDDE